ncbi:MAG TPA: carbonic anhydrase family protein [Steroidobacteraceae bacterium]|nr:carbonic anhydrase family protein [Steroidobacteraceae bacterium]
MRKPFALWIALGALAMVPLAAGARSEGEAPHWSYSGDTGPARWGDLEPDYATCGVGTRQSPIDIRDATPAKLPPIEFDYKPVPLTVVDTGHSMQVNAPAGSGGITVGADHYDLVQVHFHYPSEERIAGKRYALVAHLVHKNAQGELAVVAVLIRNGNENALLRQVFDNFPPPGEKEHSVPGATLDFTQLLPRNRGYYTFEGSLTTPPCSEHVRWLVLKRQMQASRGQIVQFAGRYPNNARPTQPTNGRKLEQTQD